MLPSSKPNESAHVPPLNLSMSANITYNTKKVISVLTAIIVSSLVHGPDGVLSKMIGVTICNKFIVVSEDSNLSARYIRTAVLPVNMI